jgi:hypothetical protein
VLRRIFGQKRDEETGGWRKLHNEKLRNFYSSPNIIRMVKSGRMRWTGHVARLREKEGRKEGRKEVGLISMELHKYMYIYREFFKLLTASWRPVCCFSRRTY